MLFFLSIIILGEHMKKLFELIFVLFVFSMVVIYRVEIHEFIMDNFLHRKEILIPTKR